MSFVGKLFVFEGADGVGKSTVSQLVTERLKNNGNSCLYLSFPGKEEGTLGNLVYQIHHDQKHFNIDAIVPASLQVLHIAAHIDAIEKKIIPAIKEGK